MKAVLFIAAGLLLTFVSAPALLADSRLNDYTGDGRVIYLGFGDSLTFGVGDGSDPESEGRGGYLPRLSALIGIPALNKGVPGEQLTEGGRERFPQVVRSSPADLLGIFEGANDAYHAKSSSDLLRALQEMINVAAALGRRPVVFTLPPPCCNHAQLAPFARSYSSVIRTAALENDLALIDLERAWKTTCTGSEGCELFNLPEGLHPNTLGYQVIAEVTAAALLDIDIFAPRGAAELAAATGSAPASVVTKPDITQAK